MYLDINKLRKDLMKQKEEEFFLGGFGSSLIELAEIERYTDEELIEKAMDNNFDIDNYLVKIKIK